MEECYTESYSQQHKLISEIFSDFWNIQNFNITIKKVGIPQEDMILLYIH